MAYKILGKYQGKTEEIDTAESAKDADFLVSEYRLAYGPEWKIWAPVLQRKEHQYDGFEANV